MNKKRKQTRKTRTERKLKKIFEIIMRGKNSKEYGERLLFAEEIFELIFQKYKYYSEISDVVSLVSQLAFDECVYCESNSKDKVILEE